MYDINHVCTYALQIRNVKVNLTVILNDNNDDDNEFI